MKVLRAAIEATEAGHPVALVTVVGANGSAPRSSGARMLVFADGQIVGTVGGGNFEYRLISEAQEAIKLGRPRRIHLDLTRDLGMCCGGTMETFIEPLQQREQLVIYGAGHVGQATANLAVALEFDTTVVDDRDEWIRADRFRPEVKCMEADPLRILDQLPFGAHCYHLVVTHAHQLDQDLLERLLPRPLDWLGMIGSRAKLARFFVRLEAAGVDPEQFKRVNSPVGLDIGAETPEEIAVSILAELIAVRRRVQRPPQPLSAIPLKARGGDGRACAPALSTSSTKPLG